MYEKDGIHLEVSEKRSENGCQCGEIRLNIKNESFRENFNLSMEQPIRIYLQMAEQPVKITAIYILRVVVETCFCREFSGNSFRNAGRFSEI